MRFSLLLLVLFVLTNVKIFAQDKWVAPAEADTLKNPFSLDNSDIKKREKIFF